MLDITLLNNGFSQSETEDIHKLIELKDLTINSDEEFIRYAAMRLRKNSSFEAFKIMHGILHGEDGLIDKIEQYRSILKQDDFILPQTKKSQILEDCEKISYKQRKLKIVRAKDIKDFTSFETTLTPWYRSKNINHGFEISKLESCSTLNRQRVLSASYIGYDKLFTAGDYGFLLDVLPENVHLAAGFDLWSPSRLNLSKVCKYILFW